MKDSMGFVHLKGLIRSGTAGSYIFRLPVGYRVKRMIHVPVNANNAFGSLPIDENGYLKHNAGSTVWFSLDGVVFKAEQ